MVGIGIEARRRIASALQMSLLAMTNQGQTPHKSPVIIAPQGMPHTVIANPDAIGMKQSDIKT